SRRHQEGNGRRARRDVYLPTLRRQGRRDHQSDATRARLPSREGVRHRFDDGNSRECREVVYTMNVRIDKGTAPSRSRLRNRLSEPRPLGSSALLLLLLTRLAAAQTWVAQTSNTTASLRGVSAVSDKIVWASGTRGTYLKTLDGGDHWTAATVP